MRSSQSEQLNEVWNVLLKFEKALVEKDRGTLDELLDPDFIGATPMGESFTKNDYINHHCIPGFGILALTGAGADSSSIRFFNETAVINRRVHSQFKLAVGDVLEYDVQRIEVFVKKEGRWRVVSGQGTRVVPLNRG